MLQGTAGTSRALKAKSGKILTHLRKIKDNSFYFELGIMIFFILLKSKIKKLVFIRH